MNQNKKNKVKDFLRKEGFYLVLFVCLCIVATVAAFTIRKNSEITTYTVTEQQNTIILAVIFTIPAVIVVIGIIVWQVRRRKK